MDNIIRGKNWWFEEINTWMVLDEVRLPDIRRAVSAFLPGGSNQAVEWPEEFEPLTAMVKTRNNDPRIRALCGREPGDWTTAYYYEHLKSFRNGVSKGRIVTLKGLVNAIADDPKRGMKPAGVEYTFGTIVKYTDLFEGKLIHKFDHFAGPGATVIDGNRPFAEMARILRISGGST